MNHRPPRLLPNPRGPGDERVQSDIARYGWHVVNVLGSPSWSYTIGLTQSYDHPELVVFGLTPRTGHGVLNAVGRTIQEGRGIEVDRVYHDEYLAGYDCVFRRVHGKWYEPFVGMASWYYRGDDFPVLQLLWPDERNVMPWHPDVSPTTRRMQPLLYETSQRAARVTGLVRAHRRALAAIRSGAEKSR